MLAFASDILLPFAGHISQHKDTRIIYTNASRHLTIIILLIWKATNLDFIFDLWFFFFIRLQAFTSPHFLLHFVKGGFKHDNLVKQTTEGKNSTIFQVTCSNASAILLNAVNIRRELWNCECDLIAFWLRNVNSETPTQEFDLCALNHGKSLVTFSIVKYELVRCSMGNVQNADVFRATPSRKSIFTYCSLENCPFSNCFHLK